MLFKGDVAIRAPQRVWDFVADPNWFGQCARGVRKIEAIKPLKRSGGETGAYL